MTDRQQWIVEKIKECETIDLFSDEISLAYAKEFGAKIRTVIEQYDSKDRCEALMTAMARLWHRGILSRKRIYYRCRGKLVYTHRYAKAGAPGYITRIPSIPAKFNFMRTMK